MNDPTVWLVTEAANLARRERPQKKETIHLNSLSSTVDGKWVDNAWRDT